MRRLWKITGTNKGRVFTVKVRAADHDEAVRKGSTAPHMLVVRDCVLIDEKAEAAL
jgi:hypothetical protein